MSDYDPLEQTIPLYSNTRHRGFPSRVRTPEEGLDRLRVLSELALGPPACSITSGDKDELVDAEISAVINVLKGVLVGSVDVKAAQDRVLEASVTINQCT